MPYHSITFYAFAMRAILRDRWNSKQVIDSQRLHSLRSLLSHARRAVPFQRERLSNIDLNNIQMENIPPTTKSEMMERFNETVAHGAVTLDEVAATDDGTHRLDLPILHGKYIVHKSSGTGGKPSWMICGLRDWAILRGSSVGRMVRDWVTLRRATTSIVSPVRSAIVAAEHAFSMTWQAAKSADLWARPFINTKFFPVVNTVENIVEGLNQFRPEYLHAYPTAAEMISRHRLDGGLVNFDPALITVGSEALTEMARDAIKRAFPRSILVDHYGMTECLPLSTQCRYGAKHINTDYAIVEAMTADGTPTPRGELSDHVLITNLINKTQPIIRYRVDDSVRISDERCQCGSVFPSVEVVSRKGSQILLQNDCGVWQMLSPPIVVDTMLHTKGVAQFQVIHVRQNELTVKFIPLKGSPTEEVAASIRREFERTLARLSCARSVNVIAEPVEAFQRTEGGGKLIQMISLVAPPPFILRSAA